MHNKRNKKINAKDLLSIFLILIFIFVIGSWLDKQDSSILPVQAGATQNATGWAWSDTIGWISFNSRNCDADWDGFSDGIDPNCPIAGTVIPDYGVNVDFATGAVTGYAWSENIGWIDFSPAGPYPSAPNDSVVMNLGNWRLSGWARALSNGAGWDGWIKMARGPGDGGPFYTVEINNSTGEFESSAWGGDDGVDVIGWISFNCNTGGVGGVDICGTSDYKVRINHSPEISNVAVTPDNPISDTYCDAIPYFTFTWDFSDVDTVLFGDVQSSFQIQVDNNSDFSSPEIDNSVNSGLETYNLRVSDVGYDGAQHWYRIKLFDSRGGESAWSVVNSFTVPQDLYPTVDFSYSPIAPSKGENIQFFDQSTAYGAGIPIVSWDWTFKDELGAQLPLPEGKSALQDPLPFPFPDTGDMGADLIVTDSNGYVCLISQNNIFVNIELPDIEETVPD